MDDHVEEERVILEHVNILRKLCRLCGEESQSDRRTDKSKYDTELQEFYKIDIRNDVYSVHPTTLCQACRCHLYRLRKDKQSCSNHANVETTAPPKRKKAKLFSEHGSRCEICEKVDHKEEITDISSTEQILSLFKQLGVEEKGKCMQELLKNFFNPATMKEEIRTFQQMFPYNSLDVLKNFNAETYLKAFNQDLLTILLTLTGRTKDSLSTQHIFPIMESIYRLVDNEFIGLWSFMQNLVTFSCTKNKQACNILGTAIPGTKYSSISSFLNDIDTTQEASCPEGDIAFIFDNEQVIGRTWNIRAQNKVKMSIITNVAVVKVPSCFNLQNKEELSPKNWLSSENKNDIVLEMCETENGEYSDSHYNELYHHLEYCIAQVKDELHLNKDRVWQDTIDDSITEAATMQWMQKCPNCNNCVEKRKRKCTFCNVNMSEFKKKNPEDVQIPVTDEQIHLGVTFHMYETTEKKSGKYNQTKENLPQYGHINSNHYENSTEVTLLDPVFVNPNSIESMILVLRHIGKKACIAKYSKDSRAQLDTTTKIRSWTFICCDGLPHALVRRLIEEYFVCSICHEGFLGIDDSKDHAEKGHQNEVPLFDREFDWIFLLTGEGHFEMNLLKSFVELNWTVFMKAFVEEMGWKSEKAQQAALRCSDNHKTWQLLNAFHIGSMLELVRPYVVKCLGECKEPNAQKFISHAKKESDNANFNYLFEMVCKYSQGIINFRAAIRRNNPQLLDSAKWMTKELFHGRCHPKYQDIEIYETFVKKIMPDDIQLLMKRFCSISKSGNPSKGQGLDFLLEEENKNVKGWLKRGIPSDQCWLSTCRNHQSLKTVKNEVLKRSGIVLSDYSEKELKLDDAIFAWRMKLRKNSYISENKHGPVLTAIDGQVLNQELINFTSESNRKRGYRIMDMLLHQIPPNDETLHHPVYVTVAEREKFSSVNSLSIAEIDNKILDIIELLDASSKQAFIDLFNRLVKVTANKKEQHVLFLEEVSAAVSYQMNVQDDFENFTSERDEDN